MIRRTPRLAALCALLLALGGCAIEPRTVPDERDEAWEALRAELDRLEHWRAEGRLVVREGRDGTPANFTWIERADGSFELRLAGPWGQGAARLSGGSGRAVLVTADDLRYTARDAQRLLARVYGWDIPVAALRQWLIGLPGPEAEYTLDRFGRLETLQWGDWQIAYGRYRLADEGLDMPAVLTASHVSGGNELRVAVQSWQLGEPAPSPSRSPVPLMGGGG
ncbi:MAG: lipoprotein insertase outer membrane protein LolB [Halofilum sp. (in: g-proteobacteria)]